MFRIARFLPPLLLFLVLAVPLGAQNAPCIQAAAGGDGGRVVSTAGCGEPGDAYLRLEIDPAGHRKIVLYAEMETRMTHRHGMARIAGARYPVEVRRMAPTSSGGWLEGDAAVLDEAALRGLQGDVPVRFFGRRGTADVVLGRAHHRALVRWLDREG